MSADHSNEFRETYSQLQARLDGQRTRLATVLGIDADGVGITISADYSGIVLMPSVAELAISRLERVI